MRSFDIEALAQRYLPECRLQTNAAGNTEALITQQGEVLQLAAVESERPKARNGIVGYWFSPTMDFLSRQKPKAAAAEEAAGLVQLMHVLSRGRDFVRQKVYSSGRFDGDWVVEVEHDQASFPASARTILPYELQVDDAGRVVQFRQRCYSYPGSAKVYSNTVISVYEREIKRNNGRE